MSRIKWIEYKGKKILYADFQGLKTPQEMIDTLDEATREEAASPTKALVLGNFEGTTGSTEFVDHVKNASKGAGPQNVYKTALVGIAGLKEILFNAYLRFTGGRTIKTFDSEQEALDWLVEE